MHWIYITLIVIGSLIVWTIGAALSNKIIYVDGEDEAIGWFFWWFILPLSFFTWLYFLIKDD